MKEAELIVSTAKLLLSQVKLTLDKNMLDNNAFTPNFEYYPLNKTIMDVASILNGQAALQQINFAVNVPSQEVTVLLDQLRLQQVIINLLSNAIKFSKANDTITIEVTTETKPDHQNRDITVWIKVTDKGIGISQQDLKNLFTPFFKTTEDQNRVKNKGSHGLGLSICQEIVKGMNGHIEVQSELGVGSTFTIVLKTQIYDRSFEQKTVSLCFILSCFRSSTSKNT